MSTRPHGFKPKNAAILKYESQCVYYITYNASPCSLASHNYSHRTTY